MKSKKGTVFIILGLVFILLAEILFAYNFLQGQKSYENSQKILEIVKPEINTNPNDENDSKKDSDLFSLYENDKEKETSETKVKEISYNNKNLEIFGIISIPKLGVELPVQSEWSYPSLKLSPCRYKGSAGEKNLIIAAHNYSRHFGRIYKLCEGDDVIFTDVSGNIYKYKVCLSQEIPGLEPEEMEKQQGDDWDLTLFTCTLSGRNRVTIRCKLIN